MSMIELEYQKLQINETSIDVNEPIFIPSSKPVGIGIESTFVRDLAFDIITHFSVYYSSYDEITTPRKFRKYGLKDMKIPENRIHTIHLIEREVDNCISLKTGEHFYKMY